MQLGNFRVVYYCWNMFWCVRDAGVNSSGCNFRVLACLVEQGDNARVAKHSADRKSESGSDAQRRTPTFASVTGELLLTLGVIVALFVVYQVWWTDIEAGKLQAQASGDLERQWADENPRPLTRDVEGAAFARMFIPSFGPDFSYAVVQGTSDDALDRGPGHYVNTQLPGQPGNFAVAGHRVGRGAPFNDLGYLSTCDAVVVETATTWYIYRVLPVGNDENSSEISRRGAVQNCLHAPVVDEVVSGRYANLPGRYVTSPGNISVLNPVPGTGGAFVSEGDLPILTLTTCNPRFSNKERMIVHAVLEHSESKVEGIVPAVLAGGE
ncbi:class E sortase [Corynebacterium neomassiliense]|uniref:class E sortase n=1 Tax=Corynebacterium neomassiliense TaxID=2079482 RepID=UPI001F479340|nr:class E sortase [Corynebacterium neomassiliense]